MLRIWGRRNSTNVRKALWCAEELGLDYEQIDAGGAFGVVNDPAFRALNPNGLVPVVESDGAVIWESNTIVRYLSARYGAGGLWPEDPAARAKADKWMDWVTGSLQPAFGPMFVGLVRTPPEKRDPAAIERSFEASARLMAIADAALAKDPYLGGDHLTMGDIPLGSVAYGWFGLPIERPSLPHLDAWYRGLTERPAYRKGVMTPLT